MKLSALGLIPDHELDTLIAIAYRNNYGDDLRSLMVERIARRKVHA